MQGLSSISAPMQTMVARWVGNVLGDLTPIVLLGNV
ncbi:MAG: Uncharacterised protein [Methanobacteriota archaeon]|jgi:hypothetical protein|nr:MAG: Uncharacterised protein [Euryarchaeota archaeon]